MKDPILKLGSGRLGPVFVMAQWARDGRWDWTADNGDKHVDLWAAALVQREGEPRLLRLTLGPLCVMFAILSKA